MSALYIASRDHFRHFRSASEIESGAGRPDAAGATHRQRSLDRSNTEHKGTQARDVSLRAFISDLPWDQAFWIWWPLL